MTLETRIARLEQVEPGIQANDWPGAFSRLGEHLNFDTAPLAELAGVPADWHFREVAFALLERRGAGYLAGMLVGIGASADDASAVAEIIAEEWAFVSRIMAKLKGGPDV